MTVEKAYQVLQAEWVKLYNVEVGDTVRVLRAAKTCELGWENAWSTWARGGMDYSLGQPLKVTNITKNICLDNGYGYPFFVLEFVKKAEPKIEITLKVNGETRNLKNISEETLLNIRRDS